MENVKIVSETEIMFGEYSDITDISNGNMSNEFSDYEEDFEFDER